MATRNMEQIAQRASEYIPYLYQLTLEELQKAHELIHSGYDGEWKAITMLFNFGFAIGCRATRNGRVTKRL